MSLYCDNAHIAFLLVCYTTWEVCLRHIELSPNPNNVDNATDSYAMIGSR